MPPRALGGIVAFGGRLGSDAGGAILADAKTVIEPARRADLNRDPDLADLIGPIRDRDQARLDELLPCN
jgi:hypothetical protein